MFRYLVCASFFSSLSLFATDYASIDLEHPWTVESKRPWHIQGDYRQFGQADFVRHDKGDVKAADGHASIFFSHFLNPNNALSWQIGSTYLKFDWDKNPRFDHTHFYLAQASVALISKGIDNWRWILNLGGTVDAQTFNVGKSGVLYGLMWGRYRYNSHLGLHVGFFGYGGIGTGYMLPVLGIDWKMSTNWQLNAIFPIDVSLTYTFARHWSASIASSVLGGPYRYPWRAQGGKGKFHHAIFEIYAPGAELDIEYDCNKVFTAGVGGGWNFGGWIMVRDKHNHHTKYFRFKSAPYGQAYFAYSF